MAFGEEVTRLSPMPNGQPRLASDEGTPAAAGFRRGEAAGTGARPVEQHGALDVARLQAGLLLVVAVGHQLPGGARMIEADGVPDLVGDGVAQVVDAEPAVEADLPRLLRVEADERAADDLLLAGPLLQGDVGEGAAEGPGLGADEDAGGCRVARLAEGDVGDLLPHAEGGSDLAAELALVDLGSVVGGGGRQHRGAVAGAGRVHRGGGEGVGDDGAAAERRCSPFDGLVLEIEQAEAHKGLRILGAGSAAAQQRQPGGQSGK